MTVLNFPAASVNGTAQLADTFTYNALGEWLIESESYYRTDVEAFQADGYYIYSYTLTGQMQGLDRYESGGDVDDHVDYTTYSYDHDERETGVSTVSGAGTFSQSFGYDASGQVISAYTSDDGSRTFSYDGDSRLTAVTPGTGSEYIAESYTYDNAGNRTAATTAVGTDSSISITSGNRISEDGGGSYDYDADGNRIVNDDVGTAYSYNAFDQLIGVLSESSGDATYTYDPVTGQRLTLSDTEPMLTQLFVYDPVTGNPLLVLEGKETERDMPGQQLNQTMQETATSYGGQTLILIQSNIGPADTNPESIRQTIAAR